MEWEYLLIKPEARGPRALLANIPTPLNFQLGNTGSIYHLTSRNNPQLSQKDGLGYPKYKLYWEIFINISLWRDRFRIVNW